MYAYSWFTLLYSRNKHNTVKQLYSNKDVKKKESDKKKNNGIYGKIRDRSSQLKSYEIV